MPVGGMSDGVVGSDGEERRGRRRIDGGRRGCGEIRGHGGEQVEMSRENMHVWNGGRRDQR